MGLSSEMYINVVHRYSHLGEKLLHITYNDIGVKLTVTLEICDGCARSKAKACAVREKIHKSVTADRKDFCEHDWSIPGELDFTK